MPRLSQLRGSVVRRRATRFAWLTRRRLAMAVGVAGALAVVTATVWLADRLRVGEFIADLGTSAAEATLRTTARAGLGVTEILVSGRRNTPEAHVIAAVDVRLGTPLLTFDPGAAKRELERLPWVKSADVERHFPGSVVVRLVEREPLALWQSRGSFLVVDGSGEEISGVDPGLFRHLPMVVGEDAPRHARALLALLGTEPDLLKRVTAAVRMAGRRWDLLLDNDIRVQLPEHETGQAWTKLAAAERKERLLDRNVTQIDLRALDRITVRVVPAAAAPQQQPTSPGRVRAGSRQT
ncbi:MAG: FtsQ-type POTRA domain-containing protein [Alphaproteobacteria bacterium]|nr:FtsQ-type POTRA domain-containing protein [Alphaproteobacteria bacterium]